MPDLIIKTVQTITGMNYRMPYHGIIDFDDDQMGEIDAYIVEKFNEEFSGGDIELISHDTEYLKFTMRASNLDGESRQEEMNEAYQYFCGICEALHLKAI